VETSTSVDLRNARDQLFAASLERFVAVRGELAVALAREGHKEDSRTLKGIHRPSVSAWATNQVVRHALGDVGTFFEAGDQLRHAQHAMLTGKSERASYQALAEVFREATTTLGATIREVLTNVGRNADSALVERVLSNFRNAAVSEDRRNKVLGGQLEDDIAVGDDDLAGLFGAMPGGSRAPSAASPRVAVTAKASASDKREEQLRVQKEERRLRLQAARDDEEAVAKRATQAQTLVTQARAACDQARAHLDEVDRAAAEARQAWRAMENTLRRAEREATEARTALQTATQRREAAERKADT
jgi:hypothetical protein